MKHWPLSVIANSPMMPDDIAPEVRAICERVPSEEAYVACLHVAKRTAPAKVCNFLVVESIDAPARRLFARYPGFDEWLQFERANVIEGDNGVTYIIIDPVH